MAVAHVKILVKPWQFQAISALCHTVIADIGALPLIFPAPNPSLATLTANVGILDAAIAAWGPVHNRGSHADWLALVAAADTVRNDLILEGNYVQSLVDITQPYATQAAFIASSGFSVKNLATPQGMLNPPGDLHRQMSDAISEDNIYLKWKKPIGLNSPGNVHSYIVFQNGVQLPAVITKTGYLITSGITHGNTYTFEVAGVNDAGAGTMSAALIVNF